MFTWVKLPGRSLEMTSVAGQTPLGCLFYITDRSGGTRFLVDTGSEVSVILPRAGDRKCTTDSLTLQAVNNTPIPTYGTRLLTLNLGLCHTFQWVFVITDVQRPIIGADFLHHFGLLVDMKQHQIMDGTTHLQVQGIVTQNQSPMLWYQRTTTTHFSTSSQSTPLSHKCVLQINRSSMMSLTTITTA